MAEEIVEIADDGANDIDGDKVDHENVQRSRLRVDARKWVAARLLPKRYGDRIQADVEHRGRVVFEMHFGGDG